MERVQGANLESLLRKVSGTGARSAHHIDSATVTALVHLSPGLCYSGRLTPWPKEAELLWQYCQCPLGSFSVVATDVLRLETPVEIASARGYTGNVSLKHALFETNASVLHAASVLVTAQGLKLSDVKIQPALQSLRALGSWHACSGIFALVLQQSVQIAPGFWRAVDAWFCSKGCGVPLVRNTCKPSTVATP